MTPSEFQAQFPDGEFDALEDSYIQVFLDRAVPYFSVDRWGDFYSEGLAYFVANSIVVSKAHAAKALKLDGGNVSEKHVGPVGMSFDGALLNAQAKDPAKQTTYGQNYAFLRGKVGMGGLAV